MTRSNFRIVEVSIEAFRGFRDARTFDLDASAVIFTGPNGTGKTSVFDALQWVLVGSIERLETLRSRKTEEHVVSRYRLGDHARVSIRIKRGDQLVSVTRSGHHRESTLEVVGAEARTLYGDAARAWLDSVLVPTEPGGLGLALSTCGMLQQDVMRSVLEAKPTERYAHISTILGLKRLEDFDQAVQEASKNATERRKQTSKLVQEAQDDVRSLSDQLEMLERRALQQTSVRVARDNLDLELRDVAGAVQVDLPPDLDDNAATDVAARTRRLISEFQRLLAARERLASETAVTDPPPTDSEISDARELLVASEQAVVAAHVEQARLASEFSTAESQAREVARLVAAALPMLSSRCPVCDQKIDQDAIERRLLELGGTGQELSQLRDALTNAESRLAILEQGKMDAERAFQRCEMTAFQWVQLRQRQSKLDEEFTSLRARLQSASSIRVLSSGLDVHDEEIVAALDRVASCLEHYADVTRDSRLTGEIDRARAERTTALSTLDSVRLRSELDEDRARKMQRLAEAVRKSRVDVTTARFGAIEPLVKDIYGRLDPHPAFKVIGFQHDMYYGKGTSTPYVSDDIAGVEADPLIIFSASQANIAALSFFLAMGLGAGDRALPFIMLDDPLQSMDDVNVLGFADLCRFLRAERQLIVSTHDRRFANLLTRKLMPRIVDNRTILYRFGSWDRRGPSVEREVYDYAPGDSDLRVLSKPA